MDQNSKRTIGWLGLACLLMLAAIWHAQVAKVAARSDGDTKSTQQQPNRRAPGPTPDPALDPVPDYVARSKKGLTDQEIRWIAEDFRNAGLDRPTDAVIAGEVALAVRAAQDRWYLSSLVDALGLTPEQSKQAAIKLAEFTRQLKLSFVDINPNATSFETTLFKNNRSVSTEFLPWKLCDLDTEQEKITSKRYFRDLSLPLPPTPEGTPDFHIKYPTHSVGPEYFLLSGCNAFEDANVFMPLLSSQKLLPIQGNIGLSVSEQLDEVSKLHPAQLKVIMLLSPQMAGRLLNKLDGGTP